MRIQRNPLAMIVEKDGEHMRVEQISGGEKCLMAMVGDLAIANPTTSNPLSDEDFASARVAIEP